MRNGKRIHLACNLYSAVRQAKLVSLSRASLCVEGNAALEEKTKSLKGHLRTARGS
jgi:hypothetical protein